MDKSCVNCIRHTTCYFVSILKDAATKLADKPLSIHCSHPVERAKKAHIVIVSEKKVIKREEILDEFEKIAGSFCDLFKEEEENETT